MTDIVRELLIKIKAIGIFFSIGAIVAFIFYSLKKRDLFGGYIGGLAIGFIGALIGGFLLDPILLIIMDFLSRDIGVNVIAGFIGAYGAVYIMNRLNHDKERKKY